MRFLLPRFEFYFALMILTMGILGVRDPRTHESSANLTGAWLAISVGCGTLIWACVRANSLRLVGGSFSASGAMQKGGVYNIGPLFSLAETHLILVFQTPSPFRSFRLYHGALPHSLEPKFLVQLFGRDGQRETLLAQDNWPEGSGVRSSESYEAMYLELDVAEEHESYFLRVHLESAPDENAVFETTVKLGVALKMRDAARFRKPNLGAARLEKVA